MRGLPSSIRGKLLAHNPTPTLSEMLSFVQRYRAIEDRDVPAHTSASASTHKQTADMAQLVGLMTELVTRQKALEDQVAKLRVFDVENKATLLESVAVQANAKTVPTCNVTNAGDTDTSPVNVGTMRL